jgi:hypothetical protein
MIPIEPRSTLVRCGRVSVSPIATFSRGGTTLATNAQGQRIMIRIGP